MTLFSLFCRQTSGIHGFLIWFLSIATQRLTIQKNEFRDLLREVLDNDVHDEAGDDHSGNQDVGVTFRASFDQSHHGVGHPKDRGNILKFVEIWKRMPYTIIFGGLQLILRSISKEASNFLSISTPILSLILINVLLVYHLSCIYF